MPNHQITVLRTFDFLNVFVYRNLALLFLTLSKSCVWLQLMPWQEWPICRIVNCCAIFHFLSNCRFLSLQDVSSTNFICKLPLDYTDLICKLLRELYTNKIIMILSLNSLICRTSTKKSGLHCNCLSLCSVNLSLTLLLREVTCLCRIYLRWTIFVHKNPTWILILPYDEIF